MRSELTKGKPLQLHFHTNYTFLLWKLDSGLTAKWINLNLLTVNRIGSQVDWRCIWRVAQSGPVKLPEINIPLAEAMGDFTHAKGDEEAQQAHISESKLYDWGLKRDGRNCETTFVTVRWRGSQTENFFRLFFPANYQIWRKKNESEREKREKKQSLIWKSPFSSACACFSNSFVYSTDKKSKIFDSNDDDEKRKAQIRRRFSSSSLHLGATGFAFCFLFLGNLITSYFARLCESCSLLASLSRDV